MPAYPPPFIHDPTRNARDMMSARSRRGTETVECRACGRKHANRQASGEYEPGCSGTCNTELRRRAKIAARMRTAAQFIKWQKEKSCAE